MSLTNSSNVVILSESLYLV